MTSSVKMKIWKPCLWKWKESWKIFAMRWKFWRMEPVLLSYNKNIYIFKIHEINKHKIFSQIIYISTDIDWSDCKQNHMKKINVYWSRRACVRHTWWRTKRSWPLFSPTFGPGGLRAPPVVAIVFTYFFFFFFFLLLLSFFVRLLLLTHFGETPVAEDLLPPIFLHN